MKLENQPKIKFVSTIDSRPIDPPLLTLLTLDEFVKETQKIKNNFKLKG